MQGVIHYSVNHNICNIIFFSQYFTKLLNILIKLYKLKIILYIYAALTYYDILHSFPRFKNKKPWINHIIIYNSYGGKYIKIITGINILLREDAINTEQFF
jgi:hypothetical protein